MESRLLLEYNFKCIVRLCIDSIAISPSVNSSDFVASRLRGLCGEKRETETPRLARAHRK